MPIIMKTPDELDAIARASQVASMLHEAVAARIAPGVSLGELDDLARVLLDEDHAVPTFLGYGRHGYPNVICTDVNGEVTNNTPRKNVVLRDGDILGVAVGATLAGWCSKKLVTYGVGSISDNNKLLIATVVQALHQSIQYCRTGCRLGEVSNAIQRTIEGHGFNVVGGQGGHGIGRALVEDPAVPNFGSNDGGPTLRRGMVLCIIPIASRGGSRTISDEDGAVATVDGSASAYASAIVAIDDDARILSPPPDLDPTWADALSVRRETLTRWTRSVRAESRPTDRPIPPERIGAWLAQPCRNPGRPFVPSTGWEKTPHPCYHPRSDHDLNRGPCKHRWSLRGLDPPLYSDHCNCYAFMD